MLPCEVMHTLGCYKYAAGDMELLAELLLFVDRSLDIRHASMCYTTNSIEYERRTARICKT
jgi:hypothetical protein